MLDSSIAPLTRCPRCAFALRDDLRCENSACAYSAQGFPRVKGKPVLIDFEDSIVDRDGLLRTDGGSSLSRSRHLLRRLRESVADENNEAAENCETFLRQLRTNPRPRVLVVGGGARGAGTEQLYAATDVEVVGVDIYDSPDVQILADGHKLPFADGSFHGVWIQAVLEHVVIPEKVVSEIRRVLADDGLIYAETPFLQHVHERAYDFTRFTRSGHRWLFRHFTEIKSGTIGGPAQSLLWSIRYLGRSLFRSDKMGSLFAVLFFWVRYLDRLVDQPYRSDAATGVYFLGQKSESELKPRDLVGYFPGVRGI